ncbi:hypothetical protein NMY22_g18182 [Coprinellus aureogranulatus]|nr:hypothetical protein NMY22_g18182 [Coprinellus aureogranulatus]
MFSLPQGTDEDGRPVNREGDTDENPIKLVGCKNEEFESLIEVMYPLSLKGPPSLSKEKWVGVLKLSRLWDMPEVQHPFLSATFHTYWILGLGVIIQVASVAIDKLSQFELTPVEKIKLGKEHGVPTWLQEGYTVLVDDLSKASLTEMTVLGWETAFRILWARDEIARSQATPNSGGYWVEFSQLKCGYCWRNRAQLWPILANASNCNYCSQSYSQPGGTTVIHAPFTSLTATTPQILADAKAKLVSDKVAEVFAEELKLAEARNAQS